MTARAVRRGRPPLMSESERRERLLAAAIEAFGSDGFEATSMDALAGAAGVGKPSAYELFVSKQGLYDEAVAHEALRLAELVSASLDQPVGSTLEQRTHARVKAVFSYADESPHGLSLLLAAGGRGHSSRLEQVLSGARAQAAAGLADVMRSDWRRDGLDAGPSADLLGVFAVEATLAAARYTFEHDGIDREGAVALVTALLVRGFGGIGAQELARADGAASAS